MPDPTHRQNAAALHALAGLAAIPGAVQPGSPSFLPHLQTAVDPVVAVLLVGSEQAAHATMVAAMTDTAEVDHDAHRSTYGRILGVWYHLVAPTWFPCLPTAPAPAPALAAVEPPRRYTPEGPLTPERIRELVAAGVLTPDLRLASDGVPFDEPPLRRPRPFLVAVSATTTTTQTQTFRAEHTG